MTGFSSCAEWLLGVLWFWNETTKKGTTNMNANEAANLFRNINATNHSWGALFALAARVADDCYTGRKGRALAETVRLRAWESAIRAVAFVAMAQCSKNASERVNLFNCALRHADEAETWCTLAAHV